MSDNLIELARERLLAPAGLEDRHLQQILDGIMGHAVDAADLYFQYSRHESWTLEDGIVRDAGHGIDQGVGVRAISGEKTGFAYSDEIVLPALKEASRAARAIARPGRDRQGAGLAAAACRAPLRAPGPARHPAGYAQGRAARGGR